MAQLLHIGYDDVTLSIIKRVQANPLFVGAYMDGDFINDAQARSMFPKAKIITITVRGNLSAMACDCENGDLTPAQAAAWAHAKLQRGEKPIVYASVSTWVQVFAELAKLGVKREQIFVWTAHYNKRPHLCDSTCMAGFNTVADCTQFTDTADGLNLDENLCTNAFLGIKPPPKGPDYSIYPVAPVAWNSKSYRERSTVELYDKLRKHPLIHRTRLAALRRDLTAEAQRVYFLATHEQKRGKWVERKVPDWDRLNLRARFKGLGERAQGKQVA